jgi:dihydroorotate dehydrogenase (NAD+) catalytic subunit
MGGVTCGADVVEFVACGATHVALGTILFSDPDACRRIRTELAGVDLDENFALAHVAEAVDVQRKVLA